MNSASFLDSLKVRRSIYALSPTSDVPDETIIDIIKQAILHVPSPFNSQTTRCLVLLGNEHQKLWGTIGDTLKPAMPPEKWAFFSPKIQEYKNGYGSCVFFDDMTAWDTIEKNLGPDRWAAVSSMTEEWTQHSSGMYQYAGMLFLLLLELLANRSISVDRAESDGTCWQSSAL